MDEKFHSWKVPLQSTKMLWIPVIALVHSYIHVCIIVVGPVPLSTLKPLVFELGLSPRRIPARNGRVRQSMLYCIIDLQGY